ncbi:MAG: hypothetical protein ACTSUF_08320 [Candidatus Heimdallarchaeaceae archaeon]
MGSIGELIGMIVLMSVWLSLVAYTIYSAYRKAKFEKDLNRKRQFNLIGTAFVIIFFGDLMHTIGFSVKSQQSETTASILTLFGKTLSIYEASLFIDGLAFVIFYAMWEIFLVLRYNNGNYKAYDKIILGLVIASIVFYLFAPYYENSVVAYEVLIYSPHVLCFLIFGLMVVGKLIVQSFKNKEATDEIIKLEERSLYITAWAFVFSFIFFILTLALLPINSKFGMMMIPKTAVYMVALISLDVGLFKIVKKQK